MAQHTPGPWFTGGYTITSNDGRFLVAKVVRTVRKDDAVGDANARLMAAAPTMFEALQEARTQIEILQERLGIKDSGSGTLSIINSALASVEG